MYVYFGDQAGRNRMALFHKVFKYERAASCVALFDQDWFCDMSTGKGYIYICHWVQPSLLCHNKKFQAFY